MIFTDPIIHALNDLKVSRMSYYYKLLSDENTTDEDLNKTTPNSIGRFKCVAKKLKDKYNLTDAEAILLFNHIVDNNEVPR